MRFCKTCILLAAIVLTLPAQARILNVPEDYESIQSAINEAYNCNDTILVQPGVYHECLVIRQGYFFLTSLISTTGDPSCIDSTVIEADSIACAVSIASGNVHIRGFTITEGYQPSSFGGGGVRCSGQSQPLLEDLLITRNRAGSKGGGVHSTEYACPRLVRCRILGNQASNGAGVSAYSGDIELQDCIISENQSYSGASAIYAAGSVSLERVLICNNASTIGSMVILAEPIYDEISLDMDRVTIYGNYFECDSALAAIYFSNIYDHIYFSAVNSIVWGNTCPGLGSDGAGRATILDVSVDYCDIENGYENLELGYYSNLEWGDNNIETDPRLVAPDDGEFAPILQSPCHDAGNPDSPPDPDGSRADIGIYPAQAYAYINGQTCSERTGLPVAGVLVRGLGNVEGRQQRFEVITDENGSWNQRVALPSNEPARFEFSFTAAGFPRIVSSFDINQPETLRVATRLPAPELGINPAVIQVQLDSLSTTSRRFTVRNYESTPLEWSARVRLPGDTSAADGSLRASIPVSDATGDRRIQGAIFDGTDYYTAGSSDENRNMIYRINSLGACIDSFPQPGNSRYGFYDLEWDGEWIWGGVNDTLYAIDRSGEVMRRIMIDGCVPRNIAFDPVSGIYWISGLTSDIYAYDRDGHFLEETLERGELRIYGLAYVQSDPDDCPLYVLHNIASQSRLMKKNVTTGQVLPVASASIESYTQGASSLFCCLDLNLFDSWILVTIPLNVDDSNNERIEVLRLRQFDDWLSISPRSGLLSGGSRQEISLNFDTNNPDQGWQLPQGEYLAEIEIEIAGSGEKLILPVSLEVVEPNMAPDSDPVSVSGLALLTCYPNPFNSSTTISYSLPRPGRYAVDVMDLNGRLVARLSDGWKEAGSYRAVLNGEALPSGEYMIQLNGDKFTELRGVTLLK